MSYILRQFQAGGAGSVVHQIIGELERFMRIES